MIPTTLVAGLLLGRWWWTVVPITVGWALLLATEGDFSFAGVALGFLNAAVGITVHQVILRTWSHFDRLACPECVETNEQSGHTVDMTVVRRRGRS